MVADLRLSRPTFQWLGLFAAPALAALVYVALPESYAGVDGEPVPLSHAGRATTALALWMAIWWMTEAIPVYATALLPLAVLPAAGARPIRETAAPYAHELIFLFMGGFVIALAMQRWGLHQRLALFALRGVGSQPRNVVGAFMLVTAVLSMWVSNTATAVMMLPIATTVSERISGSLGDHGDAASRFGTCLLLGIAYGATIGGLGTLIGTPPNLYLASFVKDEYGVEISFAGWMRIGLPLVAVFLPLAWWMLTRLLYPLPAVRVEEVTESTRAAYAALGPMQRGERITLCVFAVAASAWILRRPLVELGLRGLSDPGIAMLAALALFVIPVEPRRRVFAMDWDTASKLPWGVLILFGGGLSLASAIRSNGVGELLGSQLGGLSAVPTPLVVIGVVTLVIFLTELTSNTATTATFVPLLAALAPGIGVHPFLLVVPAAIAASCAFMLPVATPPNAVVFGSGRVSVVQMARAGLWLNLVAVALITLLVYAVVLPALGVSAGR